MEKGVGGIVGDKSKRIGENFGRGRSEGFKGLKGGETALTVEIRTEILSFGVEKLVKETKIRTLHTEKVQA